MSLILIAVIAAMGAGILYFLAVPGRQRLSLLNVAAARQPIGARLQRELKLAGIFDQAPSLFVMAMLVGSAVLATILVVLSGSLVAALFGPVLVFVGTRLYIFRRQRQFMSRAIDELVPFLNQIVAAVSGKVPIQRAYRDAVADATVLKEVLGDSAAKVAAGAPFSATLLETLPDLPLRMWAVFVRQVELFELTGGDLSTGLEKTVTQVNQMLQLQAEARADYAVQAKQQQAIMVILGVTIGGYLFVLPNGGDRIALLFGSFGGLIGFIMGVCVIVGGFWIVTSAIRDIERKISF